MGQLRTANKRHNRAIRALVVKASAKPDVPAAPATKKASA